jgi:hypothetical protein
MMHGAAIRQISHGAKFDNHRVNVMHKRRRTLMAAANEGRPLGGVRPWPADSDSTRHRIGCSDRGTFFCHPPLFRMTIQQDPYEPDRWWFAPLLYAGTAVLIAALVLA